MLSPKPLMEMKLSDVVGVEQIRKHAQAEIKRSPEQSTPFLWHLDSTSHGLHLGDRRQNPVKESQERKGLTRPAVRTKVLSTASIAMALQEVAAP